MAYLLPDDADVEGTDLDKTEMEKPNDTDLNESDSDEIDQDEDEDRHSTLVPWNEFDNPQRVTALKAYYLRNTRTNRPY